MLAHVLRHGESISNAATDAVALPEAEGDRLSALGRRQAKSAAARLAELPITRLVSSPMGRARETAAVVSERLGLEVEVWDWIHELREPDDYPLLPEAEQQRRRWSNRMREHAEDPGHAPAGGESFADLLARVERTLERLEQDRVDGTLIVSHGIFMRFLFAHVVLGTMFEPAMIDRLWLIGSLNCGLSTFQHTEGSASGNPADIDGWRCVSWMAPLADPGEITGTGGGGAGN